MLTIRPRDAFSSVVSDGSTRGWGTLCFYHASCSDGFGAAWAVHTLARGECLPVSYESLPPLNDLLALVSKRSVLVCDFSFPRETTEALHAAAQDFTVLDHHAPVADILRGLPYCTVDPSRSGAVLAWEHLSGKQVPVLLRYVEDRDLWAWRLPDSRAINAYINALPRDYEAWSALAADLEHREARSGIAEKGENILLGQQGLLRELAQKVETWSIGGQKALAVNANCLFSELGEALAQKGIIGAVYRFKKGQVIFSLRSVGDIDVAALAARFGGGGHRAAAGFNLAPARVDFAKGEVC